MAWLVVLLVSRVAGFILELPFIDFEGGEGRHPRFSAENRLSGREEKGYFVLWDERSIRESRRGNRRTGPTWVEGRDLRIVLVLGNDHVDFWLARPRREAGRRIGGSASFLLAQALQVQTLKPCTSLQPLSL